MSPATPKPAANGAERTRSNQARSRKATYFKSISLENIRCFGPQQELKLCDGKERPFRWTIILGDNGTGKTTLLQALAASWPVEFKTRSSREFLPRGFYSRAFTDVYEKYWRPFSRSKTEHRGSIYTILMHGSKISSQRQAYSYPRTGIVGTDGAFIDLSKGINVSNSCFGYGAARRMGGSQLADSRDDDPTISLFSDAMELRNSEEWLLRLDYTAGKRSKASQDAYRELEDVKGVLIDILPDVSDIRFTQPQDSTDTPSVEFETPYGWVSIHALGLGYRTLAAWMVDFASRMFQLYPNSNNPLTEPAVCLVDEIDLHLHPSWQRVLLQFLSKKFPNTQFIATAHSPLIVQSAESANLVVLRRERDHVVIDQSHDAIRGWRIDQVLTSDLFDIKSARPAQYDDLMAERKRLLTQAHLKTADRRRLDEIERALGTLPTGETVADIEAMEIIRRAAARIKQTGQ